MNFISRGDVVRACGGNLPPIPENDPDRRMMILLWIAHRLEAAGLGKQVDDCFLWGNWPERWMTEACSDLMEFNGRCRKLGWPTGLQGLKHKVANPGDWPHQSSDTYGA